MKSAINVIAAVSLNGVIGDSRLNTIPWYLPADLKYFKRITLGSTIVMGVNTFDSIGGKPLISRRNIVITRQKETAARVKKAGADETYMSVGEALRNEHRGFFVIGGQMIYNEALRLRPKRLYITVVKSEVDGDVRFPINGSRFLEKTVVLQNGDNYDIESETDWLRENDLDFKHTVFKIRE